MSESEFRDECEAFAGWCTGCREITRYATEPDAEGYECEKCGEMTVMGLEQALVAGLIDIDEDDHG